MWNRFPFLTPIILSIRNLRIRLWRTGLTLLGISLGVAVVLAIEVTNKSTIQSIENVFGQATGKAELVIIPKADKTEFDGTILDRINILPGVKVSVPTVLVRTLLENEEIGSDARWSSKGIELGRTFEVRGFNPVLDPKVRNFNLVSGTFPASSKYEILLSKDFADEKSYELGKNIAIVTPTGSVKLKVVGLLNAEGAGLLNDGQVGYIPLDVMRQIFNLGNNVNEISIQVDAGIGSSPKALEELKISIQQKVSSDARVIYSSARGNLLPEMLNTYQIGLTTFSIIAVVVGAFLIYNTLAMTIVERTREIGMLRAIGMNRKGVLTLVLMEAFILSIFGSLLGVLAGFYLSRGLVLLQNGFIELKDINITIATGDIVKSVGLGMAVTFVSAVIPALQASSISPIEALRAKNTAIEKPRPLIWILGLLLILFGWLILYQIPWREDVLMIMGNFGFIALLVGFVLTVPIAVEFLKSAASLLSVLLYKLEGLIGSGNIRRSVSRTTLTVASLMISLIMIIGINSLAYALKVDIQTWTNAAMAGDLYVSATEPIRSGFIPALAEVPGVKAVSPSSYLTIRYNQDMLNKEDLPDTLTFVAIDPALYRQVGDMIFSPGQGLKETIWQDFNLGEKVFISTVVSEKTGLKKGDQITLLTKRGEHPFTIAAINTDFASQGLTVTGSYTDLKRFFSVTDINRLTVVVSPGFTSDEVSSEIKDRFSRLYSLNILTGSTIKKSVFALLDQAFVLFDVLSLIGVVIGSIGVVNTLTMNVIERTREIGGLRSLGMTRRQVMRMILAESLSLGFMGGIYGLIMGYPISQIFIHVLNSLGGYEVEFIFNPTPYLIGLLIAFGVSQVAAIGPSRRAASINIVEAIKHE